MIDVDTLRVGFAFSAGVGTFFAPCAYPLLPGYVAFYLGDTDDPEPLSGRLRAAGVVGGLVSLGFFFVYAVLAAVVATVGTGALRNVAALEFVVGVLLVALGAAMATGRLSPRLLDIRLPERRRTKSGFLFFGIVYAAAAGCTAPVFVGIAGVALAAGPVGAVVTFAAYAAGMAVLMIALTLFVAFGRDGIVRRLSATTGRITQIAGVALVFAGLAQVYMFLFWFGGTSMFGLA